MDITIQMTEGPGDAYTATVSSNGQVIDSATVTTRGDLSKLIRGAASQLSKEIVAKINAGDMPKLGADEGFRGPLGLWKFPFLSEVIEGVEY